MTEANPLPSPVASDPRAGSRPYWLGAGVAAVLWIASGAIAAALMVHDVVRGNFGGVLPSTVPLPVWGQPQPWPLLADLVGGVSVALVHRAVTRLFPVVGDRRLVFAVAWFAAVVAGGLVGLAGDLATIAASFPPPRAQMLLNGLGDGAGVGAYWGLIQGWVPALLVVLLTGRSRAEAVRRGPRSVVALVVAAVVACAAVVGVGVAGASAARVADLQQQAVASGFTGDAGALPDPNAEGTPVPTVAPEPVQQEADWCTPAQAMVLRGDRGAATDHRSLSLKLMNFSDAACVIDGYPDIAFADQNGNALRVSVIHGGSFMTTDAAPARVEVPAHGSAITYLGWDASATKDALVASTLYAASFAGETRGSWPMTLDIVPGSTVAVTAWQLRPTP